MDNIKVRLVVQRNIGNETVTLDLDGGECPPKIALTEMDILMSKARQMFNHYIDQYAVNSPANPSRELDRAGEGGAWDAQLMNVDKLVVKIEKGQYLARVVGEGYQQHGLVIYPEVLAAHKITPQMIPIDNGLSMPGWKAKYTTRTNGTPIKVVELIPPKG